MLLHAVFKIRRHLKDRQEEVNTCNIFAHSTSFALLALDFIVIRLVNIIHAFHKEHHNAQFSVYYALFFVSEMILCFILWTLGTKVEI